MNTNIMAVDAALAEVFGRYSQEWTPSDPLTELIESVLNQRTTHAHARKAMENLRANCRDWAAVAALPYDSLVDLVRPAGLAQQKAGRIQAILTQVYLDSGTYSLEHLRGMDNRTATRYLTRLPGVGAHTAALLLVFALGRTGVMPVDSHVHRVARRLGWTAADAPAGAVQKAIEADASDVNLMDLHVNLIRLGHAQCGPAAPDCPECPLSEQCRHARLQPWW